MLGGVLSLVAEVAVLGAIVNLTGRFFPRVARILKIVVAFVALVWLSSGTS